MKKIGLILAIILCAIGLTGIGKTEQGSADSYPSHYLTAQNEVRTVSVDYFQSHSDSIANKALDKKVDGYIHSIKNIKNYNVSVKPQSVGDSNQYAENTLTDTIQLSRK